MNGPVPKWEVADALFYVWDQLRAMPIAVGDSAAQYFPAALEAVRNAFELIEMDAHAEAVAAAKHGAATALLALRLATTTKDGYRILENVTDAVRDAGTDLADW